MRSYLIVFTLVLAFVSCHESIEERAAREAKEYTKKFCPTPVVNFVRTDSTVFDITTKTYFYYCTVVDRMDNETIIKDNQNTLKNGLLDGIKENTELRVYKKAGFSFSYVLHSGKEPKKVLFKVVYSPADYNK